MKYTVNLVPTSFRRSMVARRLIRLWFLGALGMIISLTAYVAWERDHFQRMHDRRLIAESKARPFSEMQESAARMAAEIASIEQNDALVRRLSKDQTPLLPLALISAGVKACPDQLWIRHVKFHQDAKSDVSASTAGGPSPAAPAGPAAATNDKLRRRLTVEGFAVDNLAVAAFVAALRDTRGFQSVELKSSVLTQLGQQTQMAFTIESEL
jgi:hypothetical protein